MLIVRAHSKEDFIGWMFHPLLLVPIAGAELKITLMSRSKKPQNGFITLFLSIQGNTEEKALQVHVCPIQTLLLLKHSLYGQASTPE